MAAIASNNTETVEHSNHTSCGICCEKFTKTTRKMILCGKCDEACCRECFRKFSISNENEPACMWCNNPFKMEETIDGVGKCFYNKEYKDHRKKILFEIEKAQFPNTMELCSRIKKREERDQKIKQNYEKIKELEKQINILNNLNENIRREYNRNTRNYYSVNEKDSKKPAEFIQKCPANDCNGFLSTAWKCKLCEKYTCPNCMEVKGPDKNCEHVCNPDTVASVKLMRSDSKPCPKCRAMIFKISGCDQMWCTQCQVAFSWRTGCIVNGVIHNPHFYEWQRNNPNTQQNINPGADVCGGEIPYHPWHSKIGVVVNTVRSEIKHYKDLCDKYNYNVSWNGTHLQRYNKHSFDLENLLRTIHRARAHNQHTELDHLRRELQRNTDNQYIRADFILNKISESDFKTKIAAKDKERKKSQDILHVYEFFNVSITETIRELYEINREDINVLNITRILNRLNRIRLYCNSCLLNIGKLYSNCVKLIDPTFMISYNKNNSNILRDTIKSKKKEVIETFVRSKEIYLANICYTPFGLYKVSQEEFELDLRHAMKNDHRK